MSDLSFGIDAHAAIYKYKIIKFMWSIKLMWISYYYSLNIQVTFFLKLFGGFVKNKLLKSVNLLL